MEGTSNFQRGGVILLHPTSLPGPFGIGDLGPSARKFIDFLAESGLTYWQVLPLGPVMDELSPYQSTSAMAGNPYLISPELLMEDGLVSEDRIRKVPDFPERPVDIASVLSWKPQLLKDAWKNFEQGVSSLDQEFERFCEHHSEWLEDFVLFSSLRQVTG